MASSRRFQAGELRTGGDMSETDPAHRPGDEGPAEERPDASPDTDEALGNIPGAEGEEERPDASSDTDGALGNIPGAEPDQS
jgi:hypothetical protein